MIFGIAVTSFSLFLLLWAPSLSVFDNPYWSGIPVRIFILLSISSLCSILNFFSILKGIITDVTWVQIFFITISILQYLFFLRNCTKRTFVTFKIVKRIIESISNWLFHSSFWFLEVLEYVSCVASRKNTQEWDLASVFLQRRSVPNFRKKHLFKKILVFF